MPRVSAADRDKLVLALLLGRTGGRPSPEFLQNATIVDERSEEVTVDGKKRVELRVTIESSGFTPVALRLLIDPETQLPETCDVSGWQKADETLQFAYDTHTADELVAQLVAEAFPEELPVDDVTSIDALVKLSTEVALKTDSRTAMANASKTDLTSDPKATVEEVVAVAKPATTASEVDTNNTVAAQPVDITEIDPSDWQPVVVTARSGPQMVAAIDQTLAELWSANGVQSTHAADEEELLLRVYLDIAGRTPGVNEVRDYFNDKSANKYEVLVNRLLESPDHATHLAAMFRTFLIPDSVDLAAFGGVGEFDKWLSQSFQSGESYDEIVKKLLLAEGRLSRSGPLLFYSATKLDADQLASRTARVFLGTRLECAQCHDHPFEAWTQEDFWGFAAFFSRISRPRGELEAASTVLQVRDVDHGDVMMPDSETVIPPKFLNASEPLKEDDPSARRLVLAEWLASGDNPYFARATANRVWAQLFGKGIVEPLDDFGLEHPALSPELLDLLAGYLVHTDFNLKELFRAVVQSKAYRLSSGAAAEDAERLKLFAQMNIKTLTAEQVYDCITVATLLSQEPTANPMGFVISRYNNTSREAFLQQFRTPAGRQTEYQGGIPQALTLMNGGLIDGATGLSTSGLLKSLEAPFFSNEERIEVLYFSTLSRHPTPVEWEMLRDYIGENATQAEVREALSDVLWALLNSAEFTMNH